MFQASYGFWPAIVGAGRLEVHYRCTGKPTSGRGLCLKGIHDSERGRGTSESLSTSRTECEIPVRMTTSKVGIMSLISQLKSDVEILKCKLEFIWLHKARLISCAAWF